MNNIFKKVLMSMLLVSLVLCVPTFAEEVSEKEASVDIEESEVVEKELSELIEMEGPEAEYKIKNETYESEEREVVVEPKEEIEPKEELASVEPETEVHETEVIESTEFELVEYETETIESEIFEPTAESIEESETEYEIEPEEDVVSEVETEALASDIESETLVESETEVEKESETIKEDIDELETVAETETATEAKVEVATTSTLDETIVPEDLDDTVASISEVADGKCEVVVYWLTDMKLKEQGNGGSYNYSWDKFLIDKGSEFAIDENIPCVIKHSSCEQEYTLIGFTTENQKDNYWKGADYAGGEATFDKNFVVDGDMEIFAVYEAKDTYISSIIIDNEVTYKTTTIPNKAIKNICILDDNDDNVVSIENVKYYKIKNNINDVNYMFTKDSSKGAPIKVEGFSLENYK